MINLARQQITLGIGFGLQNLSAKKQVIHKLSAGFKI
jgi:hypothetical protein